MVRPIEGAPVRGVSLRAALPLLVAVLLYAGLVAVGEKLLGDPDTYWHIEVGRWIVLHRSVPHVDMFSFTRTGAPWIAKEWLSQVAYAGAYAAGGWSAVVALAAAAIASAFGLLTHALVQKLRVVPALTLAFMAVALGSSHFVARPHALALPFMVAWASGLITAVDAGRSPPWRLLPLMLVWANLHGGFTVGLALVVPLAAEVIVKDRASARQWMAFAMLAVLTACITPYGPEAILMTKRILGLGEALALIVEWQPQSFATLGPFEVCLLGGAAFALHRGLKLPPLRILLVAGLVHLALQHVRVDQVVAVVVPLLIAEPLRGSFGMATPHVGSWTRHVVMAVVVIAGALALGSHALAARRPLAPRAAITPARALAVLAPSERARILNDYGFGGYLIQEGVPTFVDGRAELYGGAFIVRHHRAVTLQNLPDFLALLDEERITATLLPSSLPCTGLLDRLPGWERRYADEVAVVHVRKRVLEPGPAH